MPNPGPARPRTGPRPLALHLAVQTASWLASQAALPLLRKGSPVWKGPLEAQADELRQSLDDANLPPEAFERAVAQEGERRLKAFLEGVRRYQTHPHRRAVPPPPVAWTEGTTRLLAYGEAGPPVLLVPSLVNRADILDLTLERSLARDLAGQGFRVFLVDWDGPGDIEKNFGLDDYIAGRLVRILDHLRQAGGEKVAVVGYCMGGLLALALAQLRAQDVASLALLATPWDFHQPNPEPGQLMAALEAPLEMILQTQGEMPVDMLQAFFASLDPDLVPRKFRAFAGVDPANPKANDFIVLEDWINDGVALAAPVARQCLFGWYGANRPAKGEWLVGGQAIYPQDLRLPSLVMVPEQDRIVPPASAIPLARALPNAKLVMVPAGHIGMMSGRTAPEICYRPLGAWLKNPRP